MMASLDLSEAIKPFAKNILRQLLPLKALKTKNFDQNETLNLSKDARMLWSRAQELQTLKVKTNTLLSARATVFNSIDKLRNGSHALDEKIDIIHKNAETFFGSVKQLGDDNGYLEEFVGTVLEELEYSTLLKFALIHWELLHTALLPGIELSTDETDKLVSFLEDPDYEILLGVKNLYERRMEQHCSMAIFDVLLVCNAAN